MATWVDFDAIKAVSLEQVLRHYNLLDSMTRKGHRVSGLCPFHPDSKTKSFKADLEKNCWNCFGACHRGGDQIDLVCVAEKIDTGSRTSDRRRAALLLQEWFGITPTAPAQGETTKSRALRHRKEGDGTVNDQPNRGEAAAQDSAADDSTRPEVINPPLGFTLKNLEYEQAYAYAETRGITRATAEEFGLAVALAGGYKGRLVIPLIDHQEEAVLVGYAARAMDGSEPKYLFPSRDKGFFKSHLVFNLARVRGRKAAVVTEGFFDCLKVSHAGFPCVSLMGSDISAQQAELLCTHFERLVLFFDGDEAGRRGIDRALVEIGRRGRYVRAVLLPDGCQPDQLSADEIRRLLTP